MNARRSLTTALAGIAMAVLLAGCGSSEKSASDQGVQHDADLYAIEQIESSWHKAASTHDLDLMMSLWAEEGTLVNQGDPSSPYVGSERLRAFWLGSGSFTHRRFSLVPSYKIQIDLRGHSGFLYFECHDVGDYDLPTRFIASDTFLAGAIRRIEGSWVFWNMTAGKAFPLSFDHYYFP